MRDTRVKRETRETKIDLYLNLDGPSKGKENTIDTGCGFLDHMLTLFGAHGRFGLNIKCKGDTEVDYHHTTEDIGIALGKAFSDALGDMKGIRRYGDIILPMDEALMMAAVDISGRDYLGFDVEFRTEKIGDFDTELVKEFFLGFVRQSGITLHFRLLAGENSHHIAESAFKAFGRILREACAIDPDASEVIPSTKGVLV